MAKSIAETLSANWDAASIGGETVSQVDTGTKEAETTKSEPVAATPSKADMPKEQSAKVPDKTPAGAAAKTQAAAAAATPQGQASTHKPPSSWAAEYHEHFGKFDPRVQQYILQREKEASDGLAQFGDKLKKLEPLGALEPVLAPWRQTWSRYGLNDAQGLGKMLETYSSYLNNPKQFIEQQARALGLQLQQPEQDPYADESQSAIPPQVQQVIGGLQQRLEQFERAQQEQRNRELQAQVMQFAQEKDEQGLPKRPYFDDVKGDIMGWFNSILQAEPNLSFSEALNKAYDKATWGHDGVRAKILESQKAKEDEARAKEQRERDQQGRFVKAQDAAKSAAKGEPPGDDDKKSGKKKDIRGRLSANWDRLSGEDAAV